MTPIDELKIFYTDGKSFNDALRILACASISEINVIMDKVDYYLEHISIINSSSTIPKDTMMLNTKRDFLKRLQEILLSEIERRSYLTQ